MVPGACPATRLSDEPINIPSPFELAASRLQIIGSDQDSCEYLYKALDYVAKGKVKVMAETYALDDIAHAYERVSNGDVCFRAVITVN